MVGVKAESSHLCADAGGREEEHTRKDPSLCKPHSPSLMKYHHQAPTSQPTFHATGLQVYKHAISGHISKGNIKLTVGCSVTE